MKREHSEHSKSLCEHVQRRAADYFPALAGQSANVALTKKFRRRYSHGYLFAATCGELQHSVFVKTPVASSAQRAHTSGQTAPIADRPRLAPLLPIDVEAHREHAALCAMESHFANVGDAPIGVPRVLDHLPDGSIVFEAIHLPTLADLLSRFGAGRFTKLNAVLPIAIENAGRWLRRFHGMTPPANSAARLATRREIVEQFATFADYLRRSRVSSTLLDHLNIEFLRHADAALPVDFDLIIGHGDFGQHNIFADEQGRVIGFDTLAHWRTSPLEDVAYFLLLLENPSPLFRRRSLFRRSNWLAELRQAFLQGYYGDESIPSDAIRLYEMIVAMDKWVSVIHSCRRASGVLRAIKRVRLALQQRAIAARLHSLLGASPSAASRPQLRSSAPNDSPTWEPAT